MSFKDLGIQSDLCIFMAYIFVIFELKERLQIAGFEWVNCLNLTFEIHTKKSSKLYILFYSFKKNLSLLKTVHSKKLFLSQ